MGCQREAAATPRCLPNVADSIAVDRPRHEGGQRLVLFMVRQAAISDADAEEVPRRRDAVSAGLLREVGTKTLDLLCSTVPGMRAVLWPLLFECLVPSAAESLPVAERDLTPAASVLCKCLLQIASRLATEVHAPPPPPPAPLSPPRLAPPCAISTSAAPPPPLHPSPRASTASCRRPRS